MFKVNRELGDAHCATSSLSDSDVDGSGAKEVWGIWPQTTFMHKPHFY